MTLPLYPTANVSVILIATLLSARVVHAQERWLEPLATPPLAAGTCLPPAPSRIASTAETTTRYRLSMVSVKPGRRREMTVSLDAERRPRMYAEMSFVSTGPMTSTGESVFGTIDLQGHVSGTRMHMTTRATDSVPAPGDTAAMRRYRAGKQHTASDATREPLDVATQRKVLELAKWLAGRCK